MGNAMQQVPTLALSFARLAHVHRDQRVHEALRRPWKGTCSCMSGGYEPEVSLHLQAVLGRTLHRAWRSQVSVVGQRPRVRLPILCRCSSPGLERRAVSSLRFHPGRTAMPRAWFPPSGGAARSRGVLQSRQRSHEAGGVPPLLQRASAAQFARVTALRRTPSKSWNSDGLRPPSFQNSTCQYRGKVSNFEWFTERGQTTKVQGSVWSTTPVSTISISFLASDQIMSVHRAKA